MADSLDDVVGNAVVGANARRASSLQAAVQTNPDEAARDQRYAATLGVSVDAVAAQRPAAKQQADLDEAVAATNVSPALHQWSQDPHNAAVVGPGNWSLMGSLENKVKSLFSGAVTGAGNIVSGVGRLVDAADYQLQSPDEREAEAAFGRGPTFSQFVSPVAKPLAAAGAKAMPANPSTLDKFAAGAGSLVPTVAAAVINPVLGAGTFAAQGAEQTGEDAQARGATENQASEAELASGGMQAALGVLAPEAIAGRFVPAIANPALRTATKLGLTASSNAVLGAAMQASGNAAAKATYDPQRDLGEGVADSAAQMAILGTAAHALLHLPGAIHELKTNADAAREGKAQSAAFDQAVQITRDSGVADRAPDRFQNLVGEMAPNASVYAPAEAVNNYLQSLPPEEASKFVSDTGIGDQLEPALATGSKVAIPADAYLAKVAPTPAHEALKGDLSFSQEGLSDNDASKAQAGAEQDIADKGAEVISKAQTDAAAAEPAQAVYRDVLQKLSSQGVKGTEAEQIATLMSSRYEARAARLNEGVDQPTTDALQEYQRGGAGAGVNFDTGGAPVESRGNITLGEDGKTLIRLMGGRDKSTIPHELGHAFLEELQSDAARPDAPERLKADHAAMRKWVGAEGEGPLTTEQHEQFARGFEQYLMEGKAPSEGLRGVFQRFKDWMTRIYKNVSALRSPVNDEARGIYSRLLASDGAIRDAESQDGVIPDFATPEAASMNAKEFKTYQAAVEDAKATAREKMTAQSLEAVKRTRTAEWKAERAKMREEVAKDVDALPSSKAFDFLVNRKPLDGAEPVKLRRADVEDVLGKEETKALPRGKEAVYADEGAHPDDVAALTGHETGEGLLRDLQRAGGYIRDAREAGDKRPPRDMMIDNETDSRMLAKHGDVLSPDSIASAATEAVHNDLRAKVLEIEHQALARQAGEPETAWTTEQLKAYAEGIVGRQKTAGLRPQLYLTAERAAARDTQRALLSGKKVDALAAKRKQVIAFHLYRAAMDAKKEIDAASKMMSRFAKRDVWKSIDQGYFNQISSLLERFGFRGPSPNNPPPIAEWADELATEGVTVTVPAALRSPYYRPAFDQMSVDEARDLRDSIRSIAHLGREAKTALVNGRRVQLDDLAAEVATNVEKSKVLKADDPRATRPTDMGAAARASLMRFETMMDMMDMNDPNGPFNRVLAHGASDANAKEAQLQHDFLGDLHAAYNEVPWDQRRTWYRKVENAEGLVDPKSGKAMKFTKSDIIGMALNFGTEDNFLKLTEGFGWDAEATRSIVNRTLSANDWQFVEKTWKALDPLFPQMADAEERLTGVRPTKVPGWTVSTPHGDLEGGYYPLKYDPTRNAKIRRAGAETMETAFGRKMSGAATLNGAAQTRTNYRGALKLSPEGIIFGHMRDVTKRIAWGEYVQSADRFLKDPRIERAVEQRLGPEFHDQMIKYVRTSVGYNLTDERSMQWMESFLRTVRTNGVSAIAGFNPRILFEHTAAHAQTIAVLGKEHWARGLAEYASDPVGKGAMIFDKSPEMVARKSQANREIADLLSDLSQHQDMITQAAARAGIDPAIVAKAREIPHLPVSFATLRLVAMPAWLGAYRKALADGMSEEEAVRYGDKVVRVAHASGAPKDLPAVQQGNEFYKLFSTFFAYHVNQWNLYERSVEGVRQSSSAKDYGRSLESFMWALPVAAMTGALFSGRHPDDLDPGHWGEWAADTTLRAIWQGLPVVRNVADAATDVIEGKKAPRDAAMDVAPTTLVQPIQSSLQAGLDLTRMVQQATGDPNAREPSPQWMQHLIEAPGFWLGLPLSSAARSAQYLKDVHDGRQQPENAVQAAEGTLFGGRPTKH